MAIAATWKTAFAAALLDLGYAAVISFIAMMMSGGGHG